MNQLCRIMQVSPSAYYAWLKRPAKLITGEELHLHRRAKALFIESRESLGSRQLMNALRTEGFQIGRYKTRSLMRRLKLTVKQRVPYKVDPIVIRQCKYLNNI
ncbi:IS3 family transposase, partial [Bathymodiolus platifrons methanotrophic gill symbiont]|uniref:IS3 family transposase n=1 Tax=Bathymodiolus platifrons methanotrophic gill symbiont TaxID=113268 RepID=UPI001125113B